MTGGRYTSMSQNPIGPKGPAQRDTSSSDAAARSDEPSDRKDEPPEQDPSVDSSMSPSPHSALFPGADEGELDSFTPEDRTEISHMARILAPLIGVIAFLLLLAFVFGDWSGH